MRGAGARGVVALVASASLGLALFLALHHPVAPLLATLLVVAVAGGSWRWPGAWLLAIPAGIPWLNFSPWTGWLVVDEFDLWMLALLAGAFAREAWRPTGRHVGLPADRWAQLLVGLTGLSAVYGLVAGLLDAAPWHASWFDGYEDPLNSVRVAKSLLYAVCLWPLLRRQMAQSPARSWRLFACGMVVGLTVVVGASIWERLAYTRLFDFGRVYRTTALFWEMHVGGGAIDAYLALAMPFGVWALRIAKGPWTRLAAIALLLGLLYACASTFSRGVYGAVVGCLVVWGLMGWRQARGAAAAALRAVARPSRWWYGVPLVLTLLLVTAVLGPQSFMALRWAQTTDVLGGRWDHWRSGVALLQTPVQWMLGRGLGRIPAHLHADDAGANVSGRVMWQADAAIGEAGGEGGHAVLQGPAADPDLGGLLALTQRVPLLPARRYVLDLELRAPHATVLLAEVCERHLLYDRRCQGARMQVPPAEGRWHTLQLPLNGPAFTTSPWRLPRLGMLAISVPDKGGQVDIRVVRLRAAEHTGLVANGRFGEGMAHWFPAAQFHFLPWHIDSLYLEILVERGVVGLMLLVALAGLAAWRLWHAPALAAGPFLAASLACSALVGAVSSVMDIPRVATLFWLVLWLALCTARPAREKKCLFLFSRSGHSNYRAKKGV